MKKGYDRNLGKVQLELTFHVTVELLMLLLKTATAAAINEKFRGSNLDFFIDVDENRVDGTLTSKKLHPKTDERVRRKHHLF